MIGKNPMKLHFLKKRLLQSHKHGNITYVDCLLARAFKDCEIAGMFEKCWNMYLEICELDSFLYGTRISI